MNEEGDILNFSILDSIASVPGHVYCKDLNGAYIWCNKGQLNTLGMKSMDEILGKTDFDICEHTTASRIRAVDLRIMNSGKPELLEEEGIFGDVRATLSYKEPLRDKKGKIIGNSINITKEFYERKMLQDEAYQNLIALRNILSNVPSNIYWKNKEGALLGCNIQYGQLETWSVKNLGDFIGKTIFDITKDKDLAQKAHDQEMSIIKSGIAEIFEETHMLSDKKHTFLSHKAPLQDPNTKEIVGIIGVSIDITKQRELEQAYKEKVLELTQALEVKDDFLNNMSHEVRTPLQGIIGMADVLQNAWDTLSDEKKRNCVKSIFEARDRLMNLLSNLLDLSKLRQGRAAFDFKYHDIKVLILDVITEFQYITQPIDLRITAGVDVHICCDDWRLKQVIRNVIANSIKHGGQDKPITITLTTHSDKENKLLKIAIQDEGVGIPENELEAIFDPFHESKRTKRMSGGTGIGLAICKDIVTAHKGMMWAENNKKAYPERKRTKCVEVEAAGSTFYITLPYEKQSQQVYTFRLTRKS